MPMRYFEWAARVAALRGEVAAAPVSERGHRDSRLPGLKKCDSFPAKLCVCGYAGIARRSRQTGKSMSRTDARSSDGAIASSATAAYLHGKPRSGPLKYTPGFLYILALFVAGKFIFADPRATLVQWGEYHLSWVEVLMIGAVAGAQVLLFALGAAGVKPLAIFNNTEFLMLTLISMTQAIVAILINARTLRRTIGVGGNG